MDQRTRTMAARAEHRSPLTDEEVHDVINSLRNITPKGASIDWDALTKLLRATAHFTHKDWAMTESNSDKLAQILFVGEKGGDETGSGSLTPGSYQAQMLERILHEGNWDGSLAHANTVHSSKSLTTPWAVLVTGVNGIRKTTAIYQPWFKVLLQEALVSPLASTGQSSSEDRSAQSEFDLDELPCGDNSFFRQLDHMITTLCNENFSILYELTATQLDSSSKNSNTGESIAVHPPKALIEQYSNLKASIFSRYRTLSELLGVLLLKEAQKSKLNIMCETSGRDIAMFHYINHLFDSNKYNKLALHFTINDLSQASQSVDDRMVKEMESGKRALESGDVVKVIYANAGGPYGSEVLEAIQADSDRVWNEQVVFQRSSCSLKDEEDVGSDWWKAEFRINAYEDKPWTIQAVKPDGSLGTVYTFGKPRQV